MIKSNIFKKLQNVSFTTDEEYRKDANLVSSHFLMSLLGNKFTKKDDYGYTPYFTQGHLLEDLIFKEEIKDVLVDKYLIIDFEPNESLQKLITACITELGFIPYKKDTETLLNLIKDLGLWKNIKDPIKIQAKFDFPEFWTYLENLLSDNKKPVLSTDQYMIIESAADRIREIPLFKDLRLGKDKDNTQYIIHPAYNLNLNIIPWNAPDANYTFASKAQLDMILYNPTLKKVTIIDFKTTSNAAGQFGIDYRKYKYYLQSYWYYKVIRQLLGADINIEFYFVVVSKTHINEQALMIKDDFIYTPGKNFDESKLFSQLYWLLNIKQLTPEQIASSHNSPIALLENFKPKISQMVTDLARIL